MSLTPEQVAAVASIVTAVLIAGRAGVWVWGREMKAMTEDRDFWRKEALQALGRADKALEVATKKVEGA